MNVATGLIILVVLPLLGWAVFEVVRRGLVYIDAGSAGLVLVRGRTTERVLDPGPHFIWPFRQQGIAVYPLRDLTYLATDGPVDRLDFGDPPLHAQLGDHAVATVSYTIRFRIRKDAMQTLHDRVGPDGVPRLVRDLSRHVLLDLLDRPKYDFTHTVGEPLDALEAELGERLGEVLGEAGFEMTMFTILAVDLGELGEVLDETVRKKALLDLERADAEVRIARAANEAALAEQLGFLSDDVLRYQRLQLAREALQRWDGRIVVNDTAASGLIAPAITGEGERPSEPNGESPSEPS